MHALTEMTRQLRKRKSTGKESKGLILANGGVLTYQHVVILSSSPGEDGSVYPNVNPLSVNQNKDPAPPIAAEAEGAATIEVCAQFLPAHTTKQCSLENITDNFRLTPSSTPETVLPVAATS